MTHVAARDANLSGPTPRPCPLRTVDSSYDDDETVMRSGRPGVSARAPREPCVHSWCLQRLSAFP